MGNNTPVHTEVLFLGWWVVVGVMFRGPGVFHQSFFDFFHLVRSTITITRQPTAARSE